MASRQGLCKPFDRILPLKRRKECPMIFEIITLRT